MSCFPSTTICEILCQVCCLGLSLYTWFKLIKLLSLTADFEIICHYFQLYVNFLSNSHDERISLEQCLWTFKMASPCLNKDFQVLNWAATWQNQQSECAPSEDSDQPGHPPSLIRVFAVRMKKPWVLSFHLSAQRRLWSDWADAQADLSLR